MKNKNWVKRISKGTFTPLEMEHILLFPVGIAIVGLGASKYNNLNLIVQVIVLVIYLGLLIGIAPVKMVRMPNNFLQMIGTGLISGVLDSFLILLQAKKLQFVKLGSSEQASDRDKYTYLSLMTIAALVGGLILWFGEVYAAPLYLQDSRTGFLSCLFIIPLVLVFLVLLGLHASLLKIEIKKEEKHEEHTENTKHRKTGTRDYVEFTFGVILLLITHNPLLCLGWLLIYSVITRQDHHLLDSWRHETEISVMLVLILALVAGDWVLAQVQYLGMSTGKWAPIVPAMIQAVLWSPLYVDESVHFWVRLTTLSTGALLLPISSLVGVMLFRSFRLWLIYMKFSFYYAIIWYSLMMSWIFLFLIHLLDVSWRAGPKVLEEAIN